MQKITGFTIGIAGAALAGGSALGLEPQELLLYSRGPVSLKPQLSVSETFNDNIFYGDDELVEKEADFITTISPGINLTIGDTSLNYLDFTYNYDQLLYLDNSQQNAGQHRFSFLSHLQRSRLTLDGRDQIEFLSSALGGGLVVAQPKVDRWTFLDEYRLNYDLSDKTAPYIEFQHSTVDIEEGIRLYDSTTLMGTLGFGYRAFSRSRIFGEVYYGQTENSPNLSILAPYPKAEFVGGFLGMRGNFTENLTGTVKAGYEHRSYDAREADSSGLPVVEVSLTQQFSPKTILTAAYSRRQRESIQVTGTASPFTSQIISANLLQHIGNEGRFRANLKAAYHMAEYEPNPAYDPDREDSIINAGLSLTYDFKLWLHGFISYDFERLESTARNLVDYTVNRATIGLTLGY